MPRTFCITVVATVTARRVVTGTVVWRLKQGQKYALHKKNTKKKTKTDQLHKVGNTEQLDGLNGKWFS